MSEDVIPADVIPADAAPATEGVKYAGSKRALIPYILQLVRETGADRVWDAMAGTTRVSQALAQAGRLVIASDVAPWSEVFATCYLQHTLPVGEYAPLWEHLNNLRPVDGWFTEHYGGEVCEAGQSCGPDRLKKPFQVHNTRRLDAIRDEIERLGLDRETRAVALTSLILALNEVDSTLGHFASYLREWSPRSYGTLTLKTPRLFENHRPHEVRSGDVFALLPKIRADLAYFDPPYGSNNVKMPASRVRYAAYYHFWTTVIRHDRPEVFGRASRRRDSADGTSASVFEEFRRDAAGRPLALDAILRMLSGSTTRWMLLSYSSGGRATVKELCDAIAQVGVLRRLMRVDYRKNVMAEMRSTNAWCSDVNPKNQEFLFLIERPDAGD